MRRLSPPHPLPVHLRTISIEAIEARSGGDAPRLSVRGRLEDRHPRGVPDWVAHRGDVIHDMEVTLTVSWPGLVIETIDGVMHTFPHPPFCPDALPSLQSLVGVPVTRGFTRAVNERLGRERGCTHVVALIQAMGPVVRQGTNVAFGFASPGAAPDTPWFIDSCQAWRRDGPLHRRWQAREAASGATLAAADSPPRRPA